MLTYTNVVTVNDAFPAGRPASMTDLPEPLETTQLKYLC